MVFSTRAPQKEKNCSVGSRTDDYLNLCALEIWMMFLWTSHHFSVLSFETWIIQYVKISKAVVHCCVLSVRLFETYRVNIDKEKLYMILVDITNCWIQWLFQHNYWGYFFMFQSLPIVIYYVVVHYFLFNRIYVNFSKQIWLLLTKWSNLNYFSPTRAMFTRHCLD